MDSVQEFLAMGGYAFYVWSSYLLTTILLVGLIVWAGHQLKNTQAKVFQRALHKRKPDDSKT